MGLKRTGFSEWASQTRRINKNVDKICMETIDSIVSILPYIDKKLVYRNKGFFNPLCEYYHKPNPLTLMRKIKKKDRFYCKGKPLTKILSEFVQGSINRCLGGIEMVHIQWMEIIDFMYDYPNLVNPAIVEDEYIVSKINEACKNNQKMNPLENGMARKFGKMWKDADGNWQHEKRRRF